MQSGNDYLFLDLAGNKYIDYDNQPWWWKNAIYDMSLDGKHIRYLTGDLQTNNYSQAGAAYFNKVLFEDNFGDPEELYQTVFDRKWTLDKMAEYSSAAYKDLNGNGKVDNGDILGALCYNEWLMTHVPFTTGVRIMSRDDKGMPKIDYDMDRATYAVDTLIKFWYNTTGVVFDYTNYKVDNWTSGEALFITARLGTATSFRDMEDDFGVIPFPMLDDKQTEYQNIIDNSAYYATIPVTAKDVDMSSIIIEGWCAEYYRSVIDVYLEESLKLKTARDENSGKSIDIIRETNTKLLAYEYSSVINNIGTLMLTAVKKNNNNVASDYASKIEGANQKLHDLIENYAKQEAELTGK